jgi:manganese/zinc/iron transport system ATP- binding protein
VLVVHHDLQTAREYFDMLILLNMRLVAFGPTEQVFTPELLQKTYGGRLTILSDVAEAVAQAERGTKAERDRKRKVTPGGGGHMPTGL